MISFQSLHRDPRFLYMARTLKSRGYDVSGVNIFDAEYLVGNIDSCDFYKEINSVNYIIDQNTKKIIFFSF